jgi:hypothetical protein
MARAKTLQNRRRGRAFCCAAIAAGASLSCNVLAQRFAQPPQAPLSLSELRAGFIAPPPQARLRCYWWWLNGHTDKATITHDLEEMRAKGFGGALLVDANGSNQVGNLNVPPGPTFASSAWIELYTHALREADRLDLEITLNITSGWNLGGPDVTPEQASKLLTWTRTQVAGGKSITVQLPAPASRNGSYKQIAVLAYPLRHGAALHAGPSLRMKTAAAETGFSMPDATAMLSAGEGASDPATADTAIEDVRDLSAKVGSDGALQWDVPLGDWEVLRIGYTDSDARVSTASGAWQGLAIDYMSRDAFNTYWEHTVEPLLAAARPFHSLKYLASDSWELGGTNWTDTFAAEFKQRRGYDPVPWLPVVAGRVVADRDRSTRFLTDLRRTVADLIVSNHYDVFAQKAAEHGLGTQAESGGPHGAPIDALETFRHSAVPQSEFWSQNPHRATDVERFFTKEAASAANIYGQRFVAQEGETSIGPQWSESLATDLKPSFDMAITEGMNRLVWHEYTSSPAATGLPGQEYFAGTHLNPKVTWWNAGGAFFTYLNRAQFMMQQGTPVDDVLYFYGDNVPNFVRFKADDPAHVLPGYDYDVTNEDALLHTIDMRRGRLIGPSGVEWKTLALPISDRVSLVALEALEAYVREGGTVIGPAPSSPTGMTTSQELTQFNALVLKVWGANCALDSHHTYGKGQVFCTHNAHAALTAMRVEPDVTVTGAAPNATSTTVFDYVHRRAGSTDIYFIRNGSDHSISEEVSFRADRNIPELWDPVTGEMRSTPPRSAPRPGVSITLAPFGSLFVIFSPENNAVPKEPVPPQTVPVRPLQPWSVTFQRGRGAPDHTITTTELTSWTTWPQSGVRFFSGTATYRATVTAPPFKPGERVSLRFAGLREIARVKINGSDAGTVWAKPLMLRADNLLKPGENTLEIEVTNLWPNRIIGDLQPDAPERITQTNITAYKPDSALLPSGLIGPAEWVIEH